MCKLYIHIRTPLYNLKMVIWTSRDTISKFMELNVHFGSLGDQDDTTSQVRRPAVHFYSILLQQLYKQGGKEHNSVTNNRICLFLITPSWSN